MPPKTTLHCPHVELPELQDSEAREQSLSSKQAAKQAEVFEVVGRLHDFEARLEGYADELLTFATEKQEVGTSGMHGRQRSCRGRHLQQLLGYASAQAEARLKACDGAFWAVWLLVVSYLLDLARDADRCAVPIHEREHKVGCMAMHGGEVW